MIHTVGPVWHGGRAGEAGLLASCYRNALALAKQLGARTIAFPAISTGVYGYPADAAAKVAVSTVKADLAVEPGTVNKVIFCVFGEAAKAAYDDAFGDLGG